MAKKIKQILMTAAVVFCLSLQAFAAQPSELVPVGKAIGIEIKAENVTIVGFSETVHAAEAAGLQKGDVVEKIDGTIIGSAADIFTALNRTDQPVKVTIQRNGKPREYLIQPEITPDGRYLGILARDTLAGIGTVTYYDPADGSFGALGHGVNDTENGRLIQMAQGKVVGASVIHVEKGKAGAPGALRGALDKTQIGTLYANTSAGIFGTLDTFVPQQEPIPVASTEEVQTGDATILSNVSGTETKEYSVRIEEIDSDDAHDRNLLLRVTDQELLSQTGGIVQGMSGSPILQNGRLVGAVTHVLVSDPTMGYGIFIGNMLDAAA